MTERQREIVLGGGEVSNGVKAQVLYWMPLPEPPKRDASC